VRESMVTGSKEFRPGCQGVKGSGVLSIYKNPTSLRVRCARK
jgi:hypothetical protein